MTRAILYARVSSDDTRNDGRNLAGQLDMCRQYAVEHGYSIVEELHEDDRGASGAAFELPQLNRIRDLARAGAFDVLVVREIDRLSRSLPKQLIVEEELKRGGVRVEYVLGEYPDTPEGNLMKNLRASIAEFERLKIRERMARGKVLKVKAGSTMFYRKPPFGYREVEQDGKWALEIVEEEAAIVRLIFDLYVNGDVSLHGLARKLTELGVPTPTDLGDIWPAQYNKKRGRAHWAKGTLARIIGYEVYTGVARYGRNAKTPQDAPPVAVPAIISRDLWERAQARRSENARLARRNAKRDYLLSGLLTCGRCGARMCVHTSIYHHRHTNERSETTFYYCPNVKSSKNPAAMCSLRRYFRADLIEGVLWGWVSDFLLTPDTLEKSLAAYCAELDERAAPIRARLAVLDDLLVDYRAQMGRLLDLYLSGDFPKEVLADRKTRLEATISALDRERADLVASLQAKTLSEDDIAVIRQSGELIAAAIAEAGDNIESRRKLLRALGVSAVLNVENDERVMYVKCVLGETVLPIESQISPNCCLQRTPSGSSYRGSGRAR